MGGQGIKGIHCIALGLAHLLSVLIQHKPHDNYIFIRRLVEQQGGLSKEGIEPSSGLVHCLGYKLGRELGLEQFLILKGIMVLRKGHGAGIKPAVNHLRHTLHGLIALGALDVYSVNIWAVKLDFIRAVVG